MSIEHVDVHVQTWHSDSLHKEVVTYVTAHVMAISVNIYNKERITVSS